MVDHLQAAPTSDGELADDGVHVGEQIPGSAPIRYRWAVRVDPALTQENQNQQIEDIKSAYPQMAAALTQARAAGLVTGADADAIQADVTARVAANPTATVSASFVTPNMVVTDTVNTTPTVIPLNSSMEVEPEYLGPFADEAALFAVTAGSSYGAVANVMVGSWADIGTVRYGLTATGWEPNGRPALTTIRDVGTATNEQSPGELAVRTEIDLKVDLSDEASAADLTAGTDKKWVDAADLKPVIDNLNNMLARLGITSTAADWGDREGTAVDNVPALTTILDNIIQRLEALNFSGQQVAPFAATFAALPAVPADADADTRYWTILTADDGANLKGIYLSGANSAAGWAFGAALSDDVVSLVQAEIESTTGANYTKLGVVSAELLDFWGQSRRVRRIFNTAVDFRFVDLPYPDRTAVWISNTNAGSGINVVYGTGGAITRNITYANGSSQVVPNEDSFNIQPLEIAVLEKDGNEVFASLIPAERIRAFTDYAAANAFGSMPHDSIVLIRATGEAFARMTGFDNRVFPLDGQPNADWFKIGAAGDYSINHIDAANLVPVYHAAGNTPRVNYVDVDGLTLDVSTMADDQLFEVLVQPGHTLTVDGSPYQNTGTKELAFAFRRIAGVIAQIQGGQENDNGAPLVAGATLPAGQLFTFIIPDVIGPWRDSTNTEFAQGSLQTGMYLAGGTAPADLTAMTPAEFSLMTVSQGASSSDIIAADLQDVYTLDAVETNAALVANERVSALLGIKTVTLNSTGSAQRHVWSVGKAGQIKVAIQKHAVTPITIQYRNAAGDLTEARDLPIDGSALTPNATGTAGAASGLTWTVEDRDTEWLIRIEGNTDAGAKLWLWGNDVGDPTDSTSYEYTFDVIDSADTVALKVDVAQLWEGQFNDQAGNTGYVWTPGESLLGAAITSADNSTFDLAAGFVYEVEYVPIRGRANSQFINVNVEIDGVVTGNFYPVSDDDGNYGDGGGWQDIIDCRTQARTLRFIRLGSVGNGNHDAKLKIEAVAKADQSVVPSALPQVSVSLTGGAGTIEGNASKTVVVGVPTSMYLDLNAGQTIATLNIDNGSIRLDNPLTGLVTVTATGLTTAITITEQASDDTIISRRISVIDYGDASPFALSGAFQEFDFGRDLTDCKIEIDFRQVNDNNPASGAVVCNAIKIGIDSGYLFHWHDTSFIRIRCDNAAAFATGKLKMLHSGTSFEITQMRVYREEPVAYAVPIATISKTQVQVSVSNGSTTVNGGAAFGEYLTGAGNQGIMVDLPAGQSIDKSATETAMRAVAGVATAHVTNPLTGEVSFTLDDGAGNVVLPITTVPTVDGVQVFTFQQSNTTFGPTTLIEGWDFDMRSDTRQGRLRNQSPNKRLVTRQLNTWRQSTNNGDIVQNGASYTSTSVGMNPGTTLGLTGVDLAFGVGGGAAAGQVEYAILDVYELSDVDRMTMTHIHTLRISAAVGQGWNNNDWRVEVHPA